MKEYTVPRWIDKDGVTENIPLTTEYLQMAMTNHELLEEFQKSSWPLGVINVTSLFSIGEGSVIYCYYDDGSKTTRWGIASSLGAFLGNTSIWPLTGATRRFCLWKVNQSPEETTTLGSVYWGSLTMAPRPPEGIPQFNGTVYYIPVVSVQTEQSN